MRVATFTLFFFCVLCSAWAKKQVLSPENSIVHGPAVNPDIVTPARYLWIQAVDTDGNNFTTSAGKDIFKLDVKIMVNGRWMQVNTQLHDRGDGSYSSIYFFNLSPEQYIISVTTSDGKNVGKSPLKFGAIQIEPCYCPAEKDTFLNAYECTEVDPQITKDLARVPSINSSFLQEAVSSLNDGTNCIVHYVLKGNRVYGKAHGPYQGFKKMMDDMLLSLARKVRLPDVEFIVNLGDWPLGHGANAKYPVFSWCSATNVTDLVMPTYKMTEGNVFGKDLENVPEVDTKCWEEGGEWSTRRPVAHFRGRDSNAIRLEFVKANNRSDMFDIALSKNMFNYFPDDDARRHDAETRKIVDKVERTKFLKFWRNKYLLSIDGTVAAYRMPALIAGDSAVIKQDSVYYEHFYHHMQPYVHYIPVKHDLSDAREKVLWARQNDAKVQEIARNGRQLARDHLYPHDVYCYYYQILAEYAKKFEFAVEVRAGLEEAVQPEPPANAQCKCDKKKKSKKDGKKKGKKSATSDKEDL